MAHVTLAIAITACLLILYLPPGRGLAVYLNVLMWYPTYLAVTIGTIDITVGRIIIAVLLCKCLANTKLRNNFKWNSLDTWVFLYISVCVIVPCISSLTYTFEQLLENRSGFLMDSMFIYIVARLCMYNRLSMIALIKWVAFASIPLALLGVIETTTGWQPFISLQDLAPWGHSRVFEPRLGFYRAVGPFPQPILFGSFFAMLLPLVYYLRKLPNYSRLLAYFLTGVVFIGALSSMSSGPIVSVMLVIFCLLMERFKALVKPMVFGFIIFIIFVEIASNRPFYHVFLSYMNPVGGAAWHRGKIIDSAIQTFNEWWLVGYRGVEPGWMKIGWTDVTCMFILNGIQYGIMGIVSYCGILICGIRDMARLHNFSDDPILKSWAWALGSVLLVILVASLGSNIRGQVQMLFYVVVGITGSSSRLKPKVLRTAERKAGFRYTPSSKSPLDVRHCV